MDYIFIFHGSHSLTLIDSIRSETSSTTTNPAPQSETDPIAEGTLWVNIQEGLTPLGLKASII